MNLKTYEGMFLFDSSAASRWDTVEAEIERIMERASAQLIGTRKWDERRLAYEINHRKRGCYALTYFKAPPGSIAGIERDARLSETILRLLIVRSDMTDEKLEAFKTEAAEQSAFLKAEAEKKTESEAEESAKAQESTEAAAPKEPAQAETESQSQEASTEEASEGKADAKASEATAETAENAEAKPDDEARSEA